MIKKIQPNQLRNHLWRIGPYMTYFSGRNPLINNDILIIIKEMSIKYSNVQILEIDWESYIYYEERVDINLIKNVNIYFEGKLKFSIQYPDFNQIYDLFQHCLIFISQKLQQETKGRLTLKSEPCIRKHKQLTPMQKERKNFRHRMNKKLKYYINKFLDQSDFTNIEQILHDNITKNNNSRFPQIYCLKGSKCNKTQPETIHDSYNVIKNSSNINQFQHYLKNHLYGYYCNSKRHRESPMLRLNEKISKLHHNSNILDNGDSYKNSFSEFQLRMKNFIPNTKFQTILKPQTDNSYNIFGSNICKENLSISNKTEFHLDLSTISYDQKINNVQHEIQTSYKESII